MEGGVWPSSNNGMIAVKKLKNLTSFGDALWCGSNGGEQVDVIRGGIVPPDDDLWRGLRVSIFFAKIRWPDFWTPPLMYQYLWLCRIEYILSHPSTRTRSRKTSFDILRSNRIRLFGPQEASFLVISSNGLWKENNWNTWYAWLWRLWYSSAKVTDFSIC